MWRRIYLLLILVRLYFALSPSYLHPDENFQGPEVIAGTSPFRRRQPYQPFTDNYSRRRSLFLSCSPYLGIHLRLSCSKHLSTMARIRTPHACAAFDLGRNWKGGST